jgi:hypothetical protein
LYSSKSIGWRLPGVNYGNPGLYRAVFVQEQSRLRNRKVCPQLALRGVSGELVGGLGGDYSVFRGLSSLARLPCLPKDESKRQESNPNRPPFGPFDGCVPIKRFFFGAGGGLLGIAVMAGGVYVKRFVVSFIGWLIRKRPKFPSSVKSGSGWRLASWTRQRGWCRNVVFADGGQLPRSVGSLS